MSWSFLKNTSDLSEFCENLNNDNWRVELIIEGIHCMSCVSRIENSLHKIKGLNKVNVHLTSNHTIIEWNNNLVKLPMLVEIIHKLGFKAFLSGGDKQLISEQLKSKQMLWNWSVSLICFFQIMMFSMPSYLSGENGLDHNLKSLFDWGSFILIIPSKTRQYNFSYSLQLFQEFLLLQSFHLGLHLQDLNQLCDRRI